MDSSIFEKGSVHPQLLELFPSKFRNIWQTVQTLMKASSDLGLQFTKNTEPSL